MKGLQLAGNTVLAMDHDIVFSTGRCILGIVLVARSERGLCALLLGDDAAALALDLRRRFPQAKLREGALRPLLSQVERFLAAPTLGLDAALDLHGSAFQKEVGEACAANPLAVAVPCHRVVRKDGGLAGYRWGVRRKRALLELEKR